MTCSISVTSAGFTAKHDALVLIFIDFDQLISFVPTDDPALAEIAGVNSTATGLKGEHVASSVNDLLERAAYHEGGHYAAAIAFGIPIIGVTVEVGAGHLYRGHYQERSDLALECLVTMCLAGSASEQSFCGAMHHRTLTGGRDRRYDRRRYLNAVSRRRGLLKNKPRASWYAITTGSSLPMSISRMSRDGDPLPSWRWAGSRYARTFRPCSRARSASSCIENANDIDNLL
jgi:hypothetical protein